MVGLVTLVTSLVDSVTSTSFLVNFGDMRVFSAPMLVSVSSGTLPGHSSTTVGLSAALAGKDMNNQMSRETIMTLRFMATPLILHALHADRGRIFRRVINWLACGLSLLRIRPDQEPKIESSFMSLAWLGHQAIATRFRLRTPYYRR